MKCLQAESRGRRCEGRGRQEESGEEGEEEEGQGGDRGRGGEGVK